MPTFPNKVLELADTAFAARAATTPELAGAVLVREQDDIENMQAHRIYRSKEGNYFLFICTAGQAGYLAKLTRQRAENALRSCPEIFRREFAREP